MNVFTNRGCAYPSGRVLDNRPELILMNNLQLWCQHQRLIYTFGLPKRLTNLPQSMLGFLQPNNIILVEFACLDKNKRIGEDLVFLSSFICRLNQFLDRCLLFDRTL